MNSNTTISREFATKAALYIAEEKSLAIEDALSYVYNSDTFQMIEDNQLEGKSIEELMLMFTNEVRYGKAH
ncbi:MAG: hypothetical protein ACI3Y6_09350 [Candidatus Cryptobacteroides sp.]